MVVLDTICFFLKPILKCIVNGHLCLCCFIYDLFFLEPILKCFVNGYWEGKFDPPETLDFDQTEATGLLAVLFEVKIQYDQ